MSSNRTGIDIKGQARATFNGSTTIQQNYTYTLIPQENKIVGYIYEHMDHKIPFDLNQKLCQSFIDLKTLITKNSNHEIIVIHGPLSTGKSTLTHKLITDKTFSFVNRIWINAESNDSLDRDFRQLYKIMRTLQNLPFDDNEDLQLQLKWLYHNLLSNSTLLIFDNAAIVDLDPNSVSNGFCNLAFFLPKKTCSVSEGMVAPSVVITSRAVSQTSWFYSLRFLKLDAALHLVKSELNWCKLVADLQLIDKLQASTLSRFLLSLITLMAPENILVDLLVHLVSECLQVQYFLELQNSVNAIDIDNALKLLEDFSMIVRPDDQVVSMPRTVAAFAIRLLESSKLFYKKELIKTIVMSVSDSILAGVQCNEEAQSDKSFINFSQNLLEIRKKAQNLNHLISNLFQFMLEFEIRAPAIFSTFAFLGNSYDVQLDQMTQVYCKYLFIDGCCAPLSKYETAVKTCLVQRMSLVRSILRSSIETPLTTDQPFSWMPMIHNFVRGDYKEAYEKSNRPRFDLGMASPTIVFEFLSWLESLFKIGLIQETSLALASSSSSIAHISKHCLSQLYSALPPECIQASLQTSQGNYLQARQIVKSALRLNYSKTWQNSPVVAAYKHTLAKIEANCAESGDALRLIDQVVAVRHQFLGPATLRYVQTVATKAKILKLRGSYEQAYKCLAEARVELVTKVRHFRFEGKAENHPTVLILRYYQAKLWSHERCSEAIDETEHVLKQMANVFSPTNHYFIKCRLLQALCFRNIGEFRKSKRLLKNLVQDASAIYGGIKNPRVLRLALAYADVLIHTGDLCKAVKLAKAVLRSIDFVKLCLEAKRIVAAVKKHGGHDAAPDLRAVVEESTNALGSFHVLTLKYKADLAEELLNSNKASYFEEASELVTQVNLYMQKGVHNFQRTSVICLTWNILEAFVLLKLKQFTECLEALDYIELLLPEGHVISMKMRYIEATALAHLGGKDNFARAHQIILNLLHSRSTSRNAKSPEPDVAELNAFLAFLTLKIKGHETTESAAEVYTLCQNSIALIGQILDEDHPRMTQAKMNLAIAYAIFGDEKRAFEVLDTVRLASGEQSGQDQVSQAIETLKLEFCEHLKKFKTRITFDRGAFKLDTSDA